MRTRLFLAAAFGAVVVSFITASVYSGRQLAEIDQAAASIADLGVPALQSLSEARRDVQDLQHALQLSVDDSAAGRPFDDRPQRAARRHLDAVLARAGPHHGARVDELRRILTELDAGIIRTTERVREEDLPDAQARALYDVGPTVRRVDTQLLDMIDDQIVNVRDAAVRIERSRRRSIRTALLLDGVSVLLAAVLSAFSLRLIRRYTNVLERRADELERFAGQVAHDILSPLATFKLVLGAVAEEPHSDLIGRMLKRSHAGVDRVQKMVDSLLQFARAGARPAPDERADVRPAMAGVIDEVREHAARERVQVELAPGPEARVRCSVGALHSIVANLVHNAIKNMGTSVVRRVDLRAAPHGGWVRIEVEDTGPGLPPGLETVVFEPYVRGADTTKPGIGLGLATVKRMVIAHGGTVGVRSQVGCGSLFWCELPA